MKLSQTDAGRLPLLTDAQKHQIVYGHWQDDGKPADAALLLGTFRCEERVAAAAQLYHMGRVPCIVPTGGVEWDYEGERLSEARYMAKLLRAAGVPEEAILLEDEARTTKENMLYGTIQLSRTFHLENIHRVIVVTADYHLRRSLGLAQCLLPRSMEVAGYAASTTGRSPEALARSIDSELRFLKELVDAGMIPEIVY